MSVQRFKTSIVTLDVSMPNNYVNVTYEDVTLG